MKNKKEYGLPIVTALMLLALAGIVSAGTCVFTQPGASTSYAGTVNYVNITGVSAIKNCTVTATSAASGGVFTVGVFSNYTNVSVNGTFSTAGQYDAADWVFAATCINSTGVTKDTCSRVGVTIDNSVPTVTTCLVNGAAAANGSTGSSDATFNCTVRYATSCSMYWKGTALAFTSGTATRSDLSLTAFSPMILQTIKATVKQISDDSANMYIACTDGTNTTTGTTTAISLDGYSPAQKQIRVNLVSGTKTYVGERNDKATILFIIAGVVALFALIAMFAFSKKK